MRRQEREITDMQELLAILEGCDVVRLAFHDAGYPYILPVNYGVAVAGDRVCLYFHGATEGKKYHLMAQDPRVGFEMDREHALYTDAEKGYCTMTYESVIGYGTLQEVTEPGQKLAALQCICNHYHREGFAFDPAALSRTRVVCLAVEGMTGKRSPKRT